MTDGLNKVLLIGHLGQEPDLRYTQGGKAVLNLSLAVTSSFYDELKEKREHTVWIKAVFWDSRAEKLAEKLSVGARISVHRLEGHQKRRRELCATGEKARTPIMRSLDAADPLTRACERRVNRRKV